MASGSDRCAPFSRAIISRAILKIADGSKCGTISPGGGKECKIWLVILNVSKGSRR